MKPIFVKEEWELQCDQRYIIRCPCGSPNFYIARSIPTFWVKHNSEAKVIYNIYEQNTEDTEEISSITIICAVCGKVCGEVTYQVERGTFLNVLKYTKEINP